MQAEIERWVRETKDPTRLRELFAALGDDPLRIAECLARPLVAERSMRRLFAADANLHGPQASRLVALLDTVATPATFSTTPSR